MICPVLSKANVDTYIHRYLYLLLLLMYIKQIAEGYSHAKLFAFSMQVQDMYRAKVFVNSYFLNTNITLTYILFTVFMFDFMLFLKGQMVGTTVAYRLLAI